eukprot:scaffold134077_cov26-Prasinocladus_malaysianus.AAC.1
MEATARPLPFGAGGTAPPVAPAPADSCGRALAIADETTCSSCTLCWATSERRVSKTASAACWLAFCSTNAVEAS